jgi:hypothetical protein
MTEIYSIGRIYKLISDNGLCYIGSTKKTLSQRLNNHKSTYKRFKNNTGHFMTSYKLFEDESIVSIDLLEEHANISKFDLQVRERFCIENNDCVNKAIPTHTKKEYYEENKEKIKTYKKDYRKVNKEKLKTYSEEYYEVNNEKIKAKAREIILCDRCKCETSRSNKSQHQKSQKCNNITISGNSNIINLNK